MTMPRFSVFIVLALVSLLSAACVSSPPMGRAAVNTFSHIQTQDLDVADVQIVDQYTPPLAQPNIEHTLVNPPYRAAYNMMNRAFQAAGANDTLVLEIQDASIIKARNGQARRNGLKFWETVNSTQYHGILKVNAVLKRSVPPYQTVGQGEVAVSRDLNLPDNMSMAEKELALNDMVEKMAADLYRGLIDVVENKFNLVQPGIPAN